MPEFKGWMSYLDLSERVVSELVKEEIDSIEEFMQLDCKTKSALFSGKYSIPPVKNHILETGIDNIKLSISKRAKDDIKYLDFSGVLDEKQLAYFQYFGLNEIGLKNKEIAALTQASCFTLADLCLIPAIKITRLKGLGEKSVNHILEVRHEWYRKIEREGVPKAFADKTSEMGMLYHFMAQQFSDLIDLRVEDLQAALQDLPQEENVLAGKKPEELAKDDYLFVLYQGKDIAQKTLGVLDIMVIPHNHGITMEMLAKIIDDRVHDSALCSAIKEFCKDSLIEADGLYYFPRPHLTDCLSCLGEDRNGKMTSARLQGHSFSEIGQEFGISPQRVNMVTARTLEQRMPLVVEDYYSVIFDHFFINKKHFYGIYNDAAPEAYYFLVTKYGCFNNSKPQIDQDTLNMFTTKTSLEVASFMNLF